MKKFLVPLLFIFFQITYGQDYLDEGLFFFASEVNQDQRTSLNLTPNETLRFKEKFQLEFEANFRNNTPRQFGNIFKIVCGNDLNIDMVANLNDLDNNFWLAVKDKMLFTYKWSDIHKGDYDKWIKFNLEVDVKESKITMTINGDKIVKSSTDIKGAEAFSITFGKSLYKNFTVTDVCPMSVKNVRIIDNNGKTVRDWPLGRHTVSNKVYDIHRNAEAFATNPKWLIDQHVFWKKNLKLQFDNLLGTAKDSKENRLFFIDSKAVYVYHLDSNALDTIPCKDNAYIGATHNFIYNTENNQLISYGIEDLSYHVFDFETSEWTGSEFSNRKETTYLHHNKLISPADSSVVTFGGYGHYEYQSSIKHFDGSPRVLTNYYLNNFIEPRYLSCAGILDANHFLVFGGYGSPSGKQGVNSQFYYDLYKVSLQNFSIPTVKKLWEFDNIDPKPFVPIQSMVINNNSDSFYTLIYDNTTYNTTLKLARFGLEKPEMIVFHDSIPYEFIDTKSTADFFLNSDRTKLYTFTSKDSDVHIFSLTYPPLSSADLYQEEISNSEGWTKYYWILIVLLVGVAVSYKLKKKKTPPTPVPSSSANTREAVSTTPVKIERIQKSAIYLFDGFQVFDKEGKDITAQFTPTLKQLFIIVLLSGIKNKKGISSLKLTDILWPNKSESNARNNRNVNISKLRILLEKIGDIEITNENAYWKINVEEGVFCDYNFVKNLSDRRAKTKLDNEDVRKLLSIVSKGEISPDIHAEWIDEYRSDLTDLIIDDLTKIAKTQDDLSLLVQIGSTILKYGPLNEDAVELKCKSLYKLGKKGEAKQAYDDFCKEYMAVLDAKFEKSFKELVAS